MTFAFLFLHTTFMIFPDVESSQYCLLIQSDETGDVYEFDPQTSTALFVMSLSRAMAIDVHLNNGYIFWSDLVERKIKRSYLNGTTIVIISPQTGLYEGLAVDWKSSHVYWTDSTNDVIMVADLEGNNQQTVVSGDSFETFEILVIDPDNGSMFWTSFDFIGRATLDGNQRTVIINSLSSPIGDIDLDRQNQRIFWLSRIQDLICTADYNGNNRKSLVHLTFSFPSELAFSHPYLYFTDTNGLHKVDASTGEILGNYSAIHGKPYGVVTYNSSCPRSGSSQNFLISAIHTPATTSKPSSSTTVSQSSRHMTSTILPISNYSPHLHIPETSSLYLPASEPQTYSTAIVSQISSMSVTSTSSSPTGRTSSLPLTPIVVTSSTSGVMNTKTKTDLVAIIFGGNEISRERNKVVVLNGSLSYDPEVGPGNHTGMNFTWFIGYANENYTGNWSLLVVPLSAPNETNIHYFGEDYGPAITFNTSSMPGNKSYAFKLVVSKDTRSSSFIQVIHLLESASPEISIQCHINCGRKISPSVKISMESKCKRRCSDVVSYMWALYETHQPTPDSDVLWQRRQDLGKLISTPLNSSGIVIREDTLRSGQRYRLEVIVQTSNDISVTSAREIATASAPSGGTCTIAPLTGISLQTEFNLSCHNWTSDAKPLTYQFQYQLENGLYSMMYHGTNESITSRLLSGNSSNSFIVQLVVVVADTDGASSPELLLNAQVTPLPLLDPSNLGTFITANNSLLNRALQSNDRYEAVGIANAVLQALSNDSSVTTREKIEIQDSIIEAIGSLPVKTIPDLLQSSSVIGSATQDPVNVSAKSLFSSLSAVDVMTSLLTTATQAKDVADIPLTTKSAVNLGTCLSNIMKAGSLLGSQDVSSGSRAQGIDLVTRGTKLVSTLSDAVLNLTLPDEEMVSIKTRDMVMMLGRHSRSMVAGLQVAVANGIIVLPADKDALMPLLANTSFLETQALAMTFNPFTWDDSKQRVNSEVITMDLKDEEGKTLKASDLSSKVHISIPLEPSKQPSEKASFFTKDNELRFHEINVKHKNTLIQLQITPEDINENLHFYLRYEQRPTMDAYDLNGSISRNGRCIWERLHDVEREMPECSMDRYAPIQTLAKKRGKYFLAVQSDVSIFRPQRRQKRSCFGHGRQKRSCVEVKNPPPTPPRGENLTLVPEYDPATDKNYSVGVTLGSCVFWSEERNVWASEGCEVSSAATDRQINCSCDHLTSFGGSLLVAPNPIDFDTVFVEFNRLEDTRNVAVIVSVAVVVFIYILVLVIAGRADKRDPKNNLPAVYLPAPSAHSYEYEIIINTGIWKQSGSTARVAMEIFGSEGNSGVLQLGGKEGENESLFCRGNRDVFVMRCNKRLGVIQKVQIGHDNTGHSPSWYLEDVVISDLEMNLSWTFSNRQWLALERGDGRIERVLSITPNQTDFKYEASKRWWRGLTERHIWVSVAAKPSLNRFTRVQRASCCLSVLLSAMLANAMFYRFDAGKPEQVIQVGPLKFSWMQVVVGVESAVVVNPINVFVLFLFQKGASTSSAQSPCRNGSKWFVYLAWFLCLCICSCSATFTIFYSLSWGKSTSEQWLASMLISFAQDVAVTEPAKILFTATLWVAILRRKRAEQTEFTCDEKKSCESLNKRLFTIQLTELEMMRKRQAKKENKSRFIVDFFIYVIFVFLLMIVCYGSRNDHRFIMTKSVRDGLGKFDEVTNNIKLWNWMRGTFLPFVYAGVSYNGLRENQTVYIGNKRSLLVGMPRARQLRVKQKSCDVLDFMKPLFPVCYGAYNKANEDKTPYSKPGWNPVGNSTSRGELHRLCPKPWRYQGAEETDTVPAWGKSSFYPGGGFVADLGYDGATGFEIIDNLQKKNWLDQQTRAIMLSFSIFNPSTNLLAAGTYFYEIQPSGYAAFFERLHVLALYSDESGFRQFYLICILFLAIFVLIYLGRECYNVYQQRSQYLKSIWNWVEIILIVLSILSVVMYLIRSEKVSSTILKLQENIYANVSFQETILWMEVEDAVLGILTFTVTIKLLRFFRFNYQVAIFIRTLRMSGDQLVSFCLVLLIGFMAFLHFGILIFGTGSERYSSPLKATYFQFELILGKVKARPINDLANANEKFGRIFVGMILVSLTIIFMNLLISLLNQMLSDVKNTTTGTDLCHFANEENVLKVKKNDPFFDSISEAIKRTRVDRLQPAPRLRERTFRESKSENRTRPDFDFISKAIVAFRKKKRKKDKRNGKQRKASTDIKTNPSNGKGLKNRTKTESKCGCKIEKEKPKKKKVQFAEDVTKNQLNKLRKKHRTLLRRLDKLTKRYSEDEVWLSLLNAKIELHSLGMMNDSATVAHRAKADSRKT